LEKIITQQINIQSKTVSLFIRREDLIHPFVSGNKFRKLKYNLLQAKSENKSTLLTFGGAFSNHIAAVASAGQTLGFKTIGIIRGEEIGSKINDNPTLSFAQQAGMQLKFITREEYRCKEDILFLNKLQQQFGDFYLIPEGGTNALAVKGCEEILQKEDNDFDYICCAIGTGGTISGIINSALPHQKVLGFPALKGEFLNNEIKKWTQNSNWELISDYHFGGYAKVNDELIQYINTFYQNNKVPLDPIYTGKMLFGIEALIANNYFPEGSKIIAIHTGGLQGVEGMNVKLRNKKSPLIKHND
jgi:1-aminocyclopropane-1-carboxylate deaminase